MGSNAKPLESAATPRRRLPDERQSITHKFSVAGFDGYVTAGLHEDGTLGEVFIVIAKEGSTVSGLVDAWAITMSMALQYGVPLQDIVRKLKGVSFEPQGYTPNPDIRFAKSIVDYIVRWLELKFAQPAPVLRVVAKMDSRESADGQQPASNSGDGGSIPPSPATFAGMKVFTDSTIPRNEVRVVNVAPTPAADGPICITCGSIMTPSGRCYRCPNCGDTSGCS